MHVINDNSNVFVVVNNDLKGWARQLFQHFDLTLEIGDWNGVEEGNKDLNSDPLSDPENLDLRSSFPLQNSRI